MIRTAAFVFLALVAPAVALDRGPPAQRSGPIAINGPGSTGDVSGMIVAPSASAAASTLSRLMFDRTLPSALELGAKGDGATNDAPAITSACATLSGKTLRFSYTGQSYYLGSDVAQATPNCNISVAPGVTFSGPGKMPPVPTNAAQRMSGNWFSVTASNEPANFGTQAIGSEIIIPQGYVGNPVAAYFAYTTQVGLNAITAKPLALNTVNTCREGSGVGSCTNTELDLNNNRGDGTGIALDITGQGNFNPYAGIYMHLNEFRGHDKFWQTGLKLQNFGTGIDIDGSTAAASAVTAGASSTGISIHGIKQNLIMMTPSDDSAGVMMYTTNAANSAVLFRVYKDGGVLSNGTIEATNFRAAGQAGVSCPAGTVNLSTFTVTNGIVTHC